MRGIHPHLPFVGVSGELGLREVRGEQLFADDVGPLRVAALEQLETDLGNEIQSTRRRAEVALAQAAEDLADEALQGLALGAAKAKFTNQSTTRSAALMLLNGSIAATAAYLVSWGISSAL